MKNLILVRGLPGAGKTVFTNLLKVDFTVSADDFFVKDGQYLFDKSKLDQAHNWCINKVEEKMKSNYDIAVHNTFTTEWEFNPYIKLAEKFEYTVHSIIIENRHKSKSIHNVPIETIRRMKNRFQIKLYHEDYNELVKVKEYGELRLHKYKRKVFYDNLWNVDSRLLDARGLITDIEGNIVQYPFTKVFNYKENGVTIDPSHKVTAVRKVNGFMAAVTLHKGKILVSTTGTIDSDFVGYAKELLPIRNLKSIIRPEYTYLFEICHPKDPHIIQEEFGAYLIGAREKYYGSPYVSQEKLDKLAVKIEVFRPNWSIVTFGDLLNEAKSYKQEGWMVYDNESSTILKLKSSYYLTAKFIARTIDKSKLWDKKYKQFVDEEFYPLCEFLHKNYDEKTFSDFSEQEILIIIRNFYNLQFNNIER